MELVKAYQDNTHSSTRITVDICFEYPFSQNDIDMNETKNASMPVETLAECKDTKGLFVEFTATYRIDPEDPCVYIVKLSAADASLCKDDPRTTDVRMNRESFITDIDLTPSQWHVICLDFLKTIPEDLRKFSNAQIVVINELQNCPANLIAALHEIYS